jgi:hypothetical protein
MTSFGQPQGTFCTQANGEQGVINDRGQCVSQAPIFAPNTMGLFNTNNVPNPNENIDSGRYGTEVIDYIMDVTGVDNSGGVKPGYSGWEQSAIMDKSRQEVERAYQLYLGRGADSGGLDYYSERLKEAAMRGNSSDINAIMNEIKNSPEGQAYAASQSSAATESTSTTTSNEGLTSSGQCDGNDFVITYSDGTVDRLPNYSYCLNGEQLANPVDHSASSATNNTTNNTPTNLAAGTYLGRQCSGTTMITLTADGQGGSVQSAAPNSVECGYQAPPPAPDPVPGVSLGTSTYTSPGSSGIGTVTGNAGGIGAVTGYNYSPLQMQQGQTMARGDAGQPVDYVKMLQGWLTNSLFQDII